MHAILEQYFKLSSQVVEVCEHVIQARLDSEFVKNVMKGPLCTSFGHKDYAGFPLHLFDHEFRAGSMVAVIERYNKRDAEYAFMLDEPYIYVGLTNSEDYSHHYFPERYLDLSREEIFKAELDYSRFIKQKLNEIEHKIKTDKENEIQVKTKQATEAEYKLYLKLKEKYDN